MLVTTFKDRVDIDSLLSVVVGLLDLRERKLFFSLEAFELGSRLFDERERESLFFQVIIDRELRVDKFFGGGKRGIGFESALAKIYSVEQSLLAAFEVGDETEESLIVGDDGHLRLAEAVPAHIDHLSHLRDSVKLLSIGIVDVGVEAVDIVEEASDAQGKFAGREEVLDLVIVGERRGDGKERSGKEDKESKSASARAERGNEGREREGQHRRDYLQTLL